MIYVKIAKVKVWLMIFRIISYMKPWLSIGKDNDLGDPVTILQR